MARRTLTVLVALALCAGSLAVVAGPAAAKSDPTSGLTDKTYSDADCKVIGDIGSDTSGDAKGYDRAQLTSIGNSYISAAGKISDAKLKAGMAALGKIYVTAGKSKSQMGALVALGKAGKAYGKALKVVLGATMSCAFSGFSDLTLPDTSSSDN